MSGAMRDRIESLFRACEAGDLARVEAILEEGRHDVDGGNYWQADMDPRGWQRSPLHVAVMGGYLELAEWLLKQGADPNPRTKYGETPLIVILAPPLPGHWRAAVELLMAHGADPDAPNDEGETPVTQARKIPSVWEAVGTLLTSRA